MSGRVTPRSLSRFFDRRATVPVVAVCLVALLCFGWGVAAARYEIFPWTYLRFAFKPITDELAMFVRGDIDENTSLLQKITNDLNIYPERHVRHYEALNPSQFREITVDEIRSRRDPPRLWMSSTAQYHRMLIGAFDFGRSFWGAILLGPSGRVVKRWYMNGEIEELTDQPDVLKNLYGVAFFPDGSAAFTMQEPSGGIIKVDVCSRVEWTKKGFFHHVIAPIEDYSAFWTFGGRQTDLHPTLVLVDASTGETLKEIDMAAVEAANPEISIFNLQRVQNATNATHPNDIEPLSTAMAKHFPRFVPGDLLISYQNTNLIFVVNPDTLKLKWWYLGSGDGLHDPDWHEDGTISIYNNNYRPEARGSRRVSTIVAVDPDAHTHHTLIDGADYRFFSLVNGNHEFTGHGTVLITSSTQGRVFEVDLATGEILFDFVNAYDWEKRQTLHLSDSFVVDDEWSNRWASRRCLRSA